VAIERALREAVDYNKINYLMLMMVDHEVHFHVVPRYEGQRDWNGWRFVDAGWPKLPDLAGGVAPEGQDLDQLVAWLKGFFA
jgi:diadenosine tetraphosphate (Ap4A) HIT family hydrolase